MPDENVPGDPIITQQKEAKARLEAAVARLKARHQAEVLVHRPNAPWWGYVALIYRTECAPLWHQLRTSHAARRVAAAAARARDGFTCENVAAGGNAAYPISPMQYDGLVSDESPTLKFFASKLPRGRNLVNGPEQGSHRLREPTIYPP